MIISSPQWPDPEHLNVARSRASELSRLFSYGSTASQINTPARTPLLGQDVLISHKRQQSNPFSILYDPKAPPAHQPSPEKSSTYINIENGIKNGNLNAFTTAHNQIPTVTVIDDSQLRRGNSVVSKLASLRHRNGIRKRNKMVRKEDLPDGLIVDELTSSGTESKGRKKKQPKVSFLFPVRRRRSFNYYPIKAAPKFSSEDEFDKFMKTNGGDQAMRELLPQSMAAYKFTNIISLIPTINIYPQLMQMPPPQPIFHDSEKPLVDTQAQKQAHPAHGRSLAPPRLQRPQQLTYSDNVEYKERIFKSYRQAVFAGKYGRPPQLHEVLPLELLYVTAREKEQLETRLLFEVLLRRTIAAKIDFRLKQQGFKKHDKKPKEKPSQNFLSSSSSGPSDRPDKHLGRRNRREPRTPRNTKPGKDLDNQNASLLSDPLPSPQISFNANMFDPVYNSSPISVEHWKQKYMSNFERSPRKFSEKSVTASKPSEHLRDPSQTYVYNFDNVDLVSKKDRSTPNLSNVNLYSMQPVTRSEATFTSSEEESVVHDFSNDNIHRVSDSTAETKSNSRDSRSTEHHDNERKRASASTTNTSVLQSLDDLSDSVVHYLRSEGAMVHNRYSLDRDLGSGIESLAFKSTFGQSSREIPRRERPNQPRNLLNEKP